MCIRKNASGLFQMTFVSVEVLKYHISCLFLEKEKQIQAEELMTETIRTHRQSALA